MAHQEAAFWREAAQAKPKEAEPEKPKRADFADDEAYLDAIADEVAQTIEREVNDAAPLP